MKLETEELQKAYENTVKSINEWIADYEKIYKDLFPIPAVKEKKMREGEFIFKVTLNHRKLFSKENTVELVEADTFFEKEGYLRFFNRLVDGGTDAVAEFSPGTWLWANRE